VQLQKLSFTDHQSGWHLSATEFFPDLTLLVGVSGVGKTRILQAIRMLRGVADGSERQTHWGLGFDVDFSDGRNLYSWACQFETRPAGNGETLLDDGPILADHMKGPVARSRVLRETLTENGDVLIERDAGGIRLRGQPTPKLSPHDSALKMLSHEERISAAHHCFQQILAVDQSEDTDASSGIFISGIGGHLDQYPTVEELRESRLKTLVKLAIAQERHPRFFESIAAQFMEVFPQVEAVRVNRLRLVEPQEILSLAIKERGVRKWIHEPFIASGMMRTIMHLARIALWPAGTLILIDEFENSLGVNCIDFVTKSLVEQSRRMQFIITSHHPYIINNISPAHWKIVSRRGSEVTTQNASDLGLEQSSHQAFIKLLNSEAYQEGIAAG